MSGVGVWGVLCVKEYFRWFWKFCGLDRRFEWRLCYVGGRRRLRRGGERLIKACNASVMLGAPGSHMHVFEKHMSSTRMGFGVSHSHTRGLGGCACGIPVRYVVTTNLCGTVSCLQQQHHLHCLVKSSRTRDSLAASMIRGICYKTCASIRLA